MNAMRTTTLRINARSYYSTRINFKPRAAISQRARACAIHANSKKRKPARFGENAKPIKVTVPKAVAGGGAEAPELQSKTDDKVDEEARIKKVSEHAFSREGETLSNR